MQQWVIYDHPTDFPEFFVARQWVIENGEPVATANCLMSQSLAKIREQMEALGLIPIPRYENDDPKIIEVWL